MVEMHLLRFHGFDHFYLEGDLPGDCCPLMEFLGCKGHHHFVETKNAF